MTRKGLIRRKKKQQPTNHLNSLASSCLWKLQWKKKKKAGRRDIFYILFLFQGSATILCEEGKLFQNQNEMVASPRWGVQNTLVI